MIKHFYNNLFRSCAPRVFGPPLADQSKIQYGVI